jgi:hypothetical protein
MERYTRIGRNQRGNLFAEQIRVATHSNASHRLEFLSVLYVETKKGAIRLLNFLIMANPAGDLPALPGRQQKLCSFGSVLHFSIAVECDNLSFYLKIYIKRQLKILKMLLIQDYDVSNYNPLKNNTPSRKLR